MRTLIIGGGVSGLALAEALEAQGHDYFLVEARDRFGGRIQTQQFEGANFDMGPAWFWPGQPRIAAQVKRFGLAVFEQYSTGLQTVEDGQGRVQQVRGFASMQGSLRLEGGLSVLTRRLADTLPGARKRLNAKVEGLCCEEGQVVAHLVGDETLEADQVILAMPPRVAANLKFEPALTDTTIAAMRGVSTWMAGQAKAMAIYDTPFWRHAGLSGDASSRFGPMVEIHDASPSQGGPYALFGFLSVPPEYRQDEQTLRYHIQAQLVRLYGDEAAKPAMLAFKDWAFDPLTATKADHAPLYAHPQYGLPAAMDGMWEGRLHFAGTEVAPEFGGFIEGALEAAEAVLRKL